MVSIDRNAALASNLKQEHSGLTFITGVQYNMVFEKYGQIRTAHMDSFRQFFPFPIHHFIFFGMAVITLLCHPSFHRRPVPVKHLLQTVNF